MPKILQFRRGTTGELSTIVGAAGELFVDTTKNTVVVYDGVTAGGKPLATETYVTSQISSLINGAPGVLDTLNELATAIGNDASFITTINNSIASKQATLVSGTNIKTVGGTSILGSGNIALFSGSYTDLTNKPTFATVATSGSYTDLTNKPALFSGSYTDLTNKPTIPTVPNVLSAFMNDVGYATNAALSNKQDVLVSGVSIKTINGSSLLGSGNITISGSGGSLDTSTFATKVDLLILDSDDIEEGLTNQYYSDAKVSSLLVHSQHSGLTFVNENGVLKATVVGGGAISSPTQSSFINLASATVAYSPAQNIIVDDQFNQNSQNWQTDSSKYSFRYMSPAWINWIANNYSQWLSNPDNLTMSALQTKWKNKIYLLVGNQSNGDINQSPLALNKLKVGDTVSITIWATNAAYQLDKFTAQTTITFAPEKFNQFYHYYDNFYDPATNQSFESQVNKFYALGLDWIKKSDFGPGELYGQAIWDPGWMFYSAGGGDYTSANYNGPRGFDATAQYLHLQFLGQVHNNWGYGYQGLETMTMTVGSATIATISNPTEYANAKSAINQIAYGSTFPYEFAQDASVYSDSLQQIKLSSSDLGLSGSVQLKQYNGVTGTIGSIGGQKIYETPSLSTLAFTGQLAKKSKAGTLDNYATISDINSNVPGWVKTVTSTATQIGNQYYFVTSTSEGSLQLRPITLDDVVINGTSTSQQLQLYYNSPASYGTGTIDSPTGSGQSWGALRIDGGIYVKKNIITSTIETNKVKTTTLDMGTVQLNNTRIKVLSTGEVDGDDYYGNTAVILCPTASDYSTGTITNYGSAATSITKTGSVTIDTTVPPGASGYSIRIPSGSASSHNIAIAGSSSFNVGTGDFTVEGWFRQDNAYDIIPFLRQGASATDTSIRNIYYQWPFYLYDRMNGSTIVSNNGQNFMPTDGITWVHYAYTRSGNTFRWFVNGTLNITGTSSSTNNSSTNPFWLYATSYGTYIYNYRITTGVARYTSSFTPSLTMPKGVTPTIGTTINDALAISGGVKLNNVSSAPTANNAVGGYLFVQSGALKYRGSNGTVTTIGAA